MNERRLTAPGLGARRALFALLVVGTTGAASLMMATVVGAAGITALEIATLALFVPTFGWITVSFWNAAIGFALGVLRLDPITLRRVPPSGPRSATAPPIRSRTALVMPAHNESPELVTAGLRAVAESLEATGEAERFDLHLLSDTTDDALARAEESAWRALRASAPRPHRMHYRRRPANAGRKAGNISEFCARCAGEYDFVVVLDADSVMSGETLVELVRTMEANPGTVERGSMAGYRDAGVTRLSLGAQSFDAAALERLGRIHGPDEIRTAYREAAAAGFDSINVDLMFGLPGQDIDRAMADVDALLELDAPHLSCYQLTLEPNTVFHRRPPPDLPDEDTVARIEARCHARLRAAGYEHYEVSAFARPGHRCRHNLNYWTFGDYLAAGAGAHGKLTRADGSVHRYRKPAHPMSFIDSAGRGATTTAVAVRELGFEYMLNVLRLADGFKMAEFTGRTGLEADAVMATLEKARDDGLLRESGAGHWQPTETGFRFLNDLQARFLP